jgi:hypothetical protein
VTRRLLPVLLAALALAGCGFGPGEAKQGPVELRVTRDFGQKELAPAVQRDKVRDSDTVMRLLQSSHQVATRYGGAFVQSIDGLTGNKSAEHDWFFYVNGSESSKGAADYKLSLSDVVQWDYHRWSATMHIPAIVGAFPQPFQGGQSGRRLPTRVECADVNAKACNDVVSALDAHDVVATQAVLGSSTGEKSLRVVVAPWKLASDTITGRELQRGPADSGVFAHFTSSGELSLLDGNGKVARDTPPGSGLVAAMSQEGGGVVWLVTGTDDAGVERAAKALDPEVLRNAFAVAATPAGPVKLPVGGF